MQNPYRILLGIKHCGKTTQGGLLAKHLNLPFIDIDNVILKITSKTPSEIYKQYGVSGFMQAEERACRAVVERYGKTKLVLSTGGGIADNAPALQILRPMGDFIFLRINETTALKRIMNKVILHTNGTWENLPAYIADKEPQTEEDIKTIFHPIYEERDKTYEAIADRIIELKHGTKKDTFTAILKALEIKE